jgi:hypothetical protein
MLVKIHKSYRWVVAVCDNDLIGHKLEEGEKALDLAGNFFRGEEMSVEETMEVLQDCAMEDATFNFVGKESVGIAKELGLVKDEGVLEIQGIPVALVLL